MEYVTITLFSDDISETNARSSFVVVVAAEVIVITDLPQVVVIESVPAPTS